MLTNTAPVATNAVKTDIIDITAGNGYTAGGTAATITSATQTSGTFKWVLGSVVFTCSAATIGPFRYVALYNSTQTTPVAPLIGWLDYGAAVTLNPTETFTVSFDATNGVLTLA